MRHTLAGFATGLSVVAAVVDGRVVGMPANSLVSVSLDPPLVSLSFDRSSTTWPVLRRADRWGISVLGESDAGLLDALRWPTSTRFEGIDLRTDGGAAFVPGASRRSPSPRTAPSKPGTTPWCCSTSRTSPATTTNARWCSSAAPSTPFRPHRSTDMADKKLVLGMGMIDGYGGLHGAWRAPHMDPATYADVDATVRHAHPTDYPGTTLRANLGVPDQYGIDPRISGGGA